MPAFRLFSRGSAFEGARIGAILRQETVGGGLLLAATAIALLWANLAPGEYAAVRGLHVGPAALHLDLALEQWAADGLLAIFFFVAGLELKRELVAGDLRDPRRAALPVAAAVAGMVAPALIYVLVNVLADPGSTDGALRGWAVPTATDIAFALAVLAVVGSGLPTAMRTFLLTLAVVDDLLAIVVIALFFTDHLRVLWVLLALAPLLGFALAVRRWARGGGAVGWALVPLAVATWVLVHESGIHATVAGVLLAATVPVARSVVGTTDSPTPAERLEDLTRPLSAGFAVPVFAFFSAGVPVAGAAGLREALTDPVALGVLVGLVVGKAAGVLGAVAVIGRFTRAELDAAIGRTQMVGLALLTGIGFTVSLLIGELAFGAGSVRDEHVKVGVLGGSLISALLATAVLRAARRPISSDRSG